MNPGSNNNIVGDQKTAADGSLSRLADLAEALGSEPLRDEANALLRRTAEGRFYVACVGQFKRGKSTLLNALIGDRVLPAGVLPLTTIPTVVRYGSNKRAQVRFEDRTWREIPPKDLPEYVSEELNPENAKKVLGVEVFVPSSLLADGMCLVDTPGLGSVFAGNTAATRAFIPHIDAAIIVVGADPPIGGEELALVEEIGKAVMDLLIVINKADRTSDEERRGARIFTQQMLQKRLQRPIDAIYEVSAEERLSNRGPQRDWDFLVAALNRLVSDSGRSLVRKAAERGFGRIRDELHAVVTEEREALVRPIEESETRIRALRQTIAEAERSLRDISYLFMAEEHHLSDMFLNQRKAFLAGALPKANAEFERELMELPRRYGPTFRRAALHTAQLVAERHIRPWLESEQVVAEREYRKVAFRFASIGNDFLKKLSDSGTSEFARLPTALDLDGGFAVRSQFTFEQLLHVARPASPLRYIADLLLGLIYGYAAIEKDAWAFLDYLMEMNSTRVQSDVVNRVQESRAQLETEIRKLLHQITRIAEDALERARATKLEGIAAVEAALTRLANIENELIRLTAPPDPISVES